jgi:DNA-binding cell septation regulator SpoVG
MRIVPDVSTQVNPAITPDNEQERIEVIHFAACNERFVRARCRVRVGELIISDVRIVSPTLGQPFVQMPSRKIEEEWMPLINILSPSLRSAIDEAVMTAWRGRP